MEYQKLLKRKVRAIEDKNEDALCAACSDLAFFYMNEENFQKALNEFETLAKVYKKQKKMIDFATVNRGMGEAYMLLTDFEKAIKHQKVYLALSRDQASILEEQRALATLGHTYLTKYIDRKEDLMDLNLAYKYTLKSLEVCDRLTDVKKYDLADIRARLYNNLGVIYEFQGSQDKSMEMFNKTILICKANDIYECLHQAYNSLASLLDRRGEYNTAIQNYNFAIDTAKKLKNKVSLLYDCLVSKANILLKLGDIQAAKKNLHSAYKLKLPNKLKVDVEKKLKIVVSLYRREKDMVSKCYKGPELQSFYEKMGDGFSSLGSYDKAIEYYLKMLNVAEETKSDLAPCYYSLAATYRDDGRFDKAIEYFEKEYLLCDFKKGLDTLCEIADTKESSNCLSSEVINVYERAINSCIKAKNQREEGRMLGRLIDYLKRTQNLDQVAQYTKQFEETGFVPSDTEESQSVNSEDSVSLGNITDDSEESESENPSKKRRSKTFQIKRNAKGETQLHTACISGKTNVVKHLLEQGHPVNVRDNGGWLPLHDACISGHYDVVKLLLDKGAAVNDRGGTHCNGITPLHDAAVNGHLEIMELLLDRGASVLSKTDEGETPFHYLKKTSIELNFDEEHKKKCEKILDKMSAILDKAGQSKEINTRIKNSAFVSGQGGEQIMSNRGRRRREASRINMNDDESDGDFISSQYKRNTRRVSSSSEEEDPDQIRMLSKKVGAPETHATCEYKMVMDCLRKKPCDVAPTVVKDSLKRTAFIMNDEFVDDDWLEDDLGTKTKKRKTNYSDGFINSLNTRSITPNANDNSLKRHNSLETISSKSSKSSSKSKGKSPLKKSHRSNSNETLHSNRSENAENIQEIEDISLDAAIVVSSYDSDDDFVNFRDNRNKQQSSLFDSGFVRCTTSSGMVGTSSKSSHKRTLQPKITHFGSSSPTKVTQASTKRSSSSPKKWTQSSPIKSILINDDPILAMDVNIEGRPFRVTTRMSLKNTLTVKWLAMEAARRYAKKEYVEPVLELTTGTGAELVDDDPIGTLFITDNQVVEVKAKVLKWNLPLIRERYKEACSDMNTTPLDIVCQKLDTMTITLDIKNNGLHSTAVAPLCKALLRENRLLELDLSNNFLSLDCIKFLAASLQTLENLTKLNLSCTNLKAEELRFLANTLLNSPVNILTKLYSLDLGENFICDESLQDIATITRHLNLKEINLSLLNFTEDVFKKSYNRNAMFCLNNLEVLKLSGNNFGNDDIEKFLTFVDPSRLTNLDVSNNRTSPGLLTNIVNCLNKEGVRINFEQLNLIRCSVEDSEVFNLLRCADNLETLDLSYTKITSLSLRRLLESPATRNIRLLGCANINNYFEESDNLWTVTDHCSNQKSLKITCDPNKVNILIRLWKKKYCDKACIQQHNGMLILK